jgi:aminoglycoside phosphotransferase (APT) family kinase protein
VTEKIHDDEPDTGEPIVRALLDAEGLRWANAPLEYLASSGTDNAMWRIRLDGEPDLVVRLPRRPGAAAGVLQEMAVLQRLAEASFDTVALTPRVRHVGRPHERFPHHWSVLEWIDGDDAWALRDRLAGRSLDALAEDLARAVQAIGAIDIDDVKPRSPGSRGGPLGPLLDRLHGWLDDPEWNAPSLLDVDAARRLAATAIEVIDEPVAEGFVHGDLIPGNLLVEGDRLTAILDWGGAGRGDTAQDLAPAWALLTSAERSVFRDTLGVDDAAWIRGRTFELEHAIGGVLYYVPRRHPLGDVMARTLQRILEES